MRLPSTSTPNVAYWPARYVNGPPGSTCSRKRSSATARRSSIRRQKLFHCHEDRPLISFDARRSTTGMRGGVDPSVAKASSIDKRGSAREEWQLPELCAETGMSLAVRGSGLLMLLLHLLHHLLHIKFLDGAGDALLRVGDNFGQDHAAIGIHFLNQPKWRHLVAGPNVRIALVVPPVLTGESARRNRDGIAAHRVPLVHRILHAFLPCRIGIEGHLHGSLAGHLDNHAVKLEIILGEERFADAALVFVIGRDEFHPVAIFPLNGFLGDNVMQMYIVAKESVEGKDGYWMEFVTTDDKNQSSVGKALFTKDDFQFHRMIVQVPGQGAMEMPFNPNAARKESMQDTMNEWHSVGSDTITVPRHFLL